MTAFRQLLTIGLLGAVAVAALSLRSDREAWSNFPSADRVAIAGCHDHSAGCMIEIRYAYPAGDLSVVPPDLFF